MGPAAGRHEGLKMIEKRRIGRVGIEKRETALRDVGKLENGKRLCGWPDVVDYV